jgi:hypothetical protein
LRHSDQFSNVHPVVPQITHRLIGFGLLLAFSICYMEWGGDQSAFVFEAQYQIVTGPTGGIDTFTHPIVIGALTGQLLLLVYAFRSTPRPLVAWVGVAILSPVVLLILIGNVLSNNLKPVASVLPFVALTIVLWRHGRRLRARS